MIRNAKAVKAVQTTILALVTLWIFSGIQSTIIKQSFRIEGVTVSSNFSSLLERWKMGDFCKPDGDSIALTNRERHANIAVTRKKDTVMLLEGNEMTAGEECLVAGDSLERVHTVLGKPTGESEEEGHSEYYYIKNFLNRKILVIRIEYVDGRATNYVVQDAQL